MINKNKINKLLNQDINILCSTFLRDPHGLFLFDENHPHWDEILKYSLKNHSLYYISNDLLDTKEICEKFEYFYLVYTSLGSQFWNLLDKFDLNEQNLLYLINVAPVESHYFFGERIESNETLLNALIHQLKKESTNTDALAGVHKLSVLFSEKIKPYILDGSIKLSNVKHYHFLFYQISQDNDYLDNMDLFLPCLNIGRSFFENFFAKIPTDKINHFIGLFYQENIAVSYSGTVEKMHSSGLIKLFLEACLEKRESLTPVERANIANFYCSIKNNQLWRILGEYKELFTKLCLSANIKNVNDEFIYSFIENISVEYLNDLPVDLRHKFIDYTLSNEIHTLPAWLFSLDDSDINFKVIHHKNAQLIIDNIDKYNFLNISTIANLILETPQRIKNFLKNPTYFSNAELSKILIKKNPVFLTEVNPDFLTEEMIMATLYKKISLINDVILVRHSTPQFQNVVTMYKNAEQISHTLQVPTLKVFKEKLLSQINNTGLTLSNIELEMD